MDDVVTVCECGGCEKMFFVPGGVENYNTKPSPVVENVNCPYGCEATEINYVGETKII